MSEQTPESIASDFDRIAQLPDDPWDHNRLYLGVLLRELPPRVGDALEVGCGAGELTARLAARAERVIAIDLSHEMLAAARARCAGLANVELVGADALEYRLAPASFDAIASVPRRRGRDPSRRPPAAPPVLALLTGLAEAQSVSSAG